MPGNADGVSVREKREIRDALSFSCGGESGGVYDGADGGRAGAFAYTGWVRGFAGGFCGVRAGCAPQRQKVIKITLADFWSACVEI